MIAHIVDGVPSPQEGIAKDSQGANRFGEIHSHEGRNATSLYLEDIIVRADGEVMTGESKGDIGESVACAAINGVLSRPRFLGAEFFVAVCGENGG